MTGPRRASGRWNLDRWDAAFPVLIRYTGLLLTVVLVGFSLAGFYVQAAPGFVAAGGMILYKTVRDAARRDNGS